MIFKAWPRQSCAYIAEVVSFSLRQLFLVLFNMHFSQTGLGKGYFYLVCYSLVFHNLFKDLAGQHSWPGDASVFPLPQTLSLRDAWHFPRSSLHVRWTRKSPVLRLHASNHQWETRAEPKKQSQVHKCIGLKLFIYSMVLCTLIRTTSLGADAA